MTARRLLLAGIVAVSSAGVAGVARADLRAEAGGVVVTSSGEGSPCDGSTGDCDPYRWQWACAQPGVYVAGDKVVSASTCQPADTLRMLDGLPSPVDTPDL